MLGLTRGVIGFNLGGIVHLGGPGRSTLGACIIYSFRSRGPCRTT